MIGMDHLGGETDEGINIVQLAERMAALGHEVHVLAADAYAPRKSAYAAGNPVVEYLPTRLTTIFPPAIFPLTPSLLRRFHAGRVDVVQSGELFHTGSVLSSLGTRGLDTKFFVWQELDVIMRGPMGSVQRAFYRTMGRAVARHCSTIIPRSRSARSHLLAYGTAPEKIGPVVHSGVDTTLFKPLNRAACRHALGLPGDRRVILAAGRLDSIKGLDTLVRAMQQASAEAPESLLVLQGTGPELEALKALVRRLGLEEQVMFIPRTFPHDKMPEVLNAADAVAFASRIDLFPFVAIEAIACGVPVVTSFARGLRTDIVDQGAGVMLRPGPDEMGADLASAIGDDRLLRGLGARGRDLALAEFDFGVSAGRLISIYEGGAG